jgi:hypothetical protein
MQNKPIANWHRTSITQNGGSTRSTRSTRSTSLIPHHRNPPDRTGFCRNSPRAHYAVVSFNRFWIFLKIQNGYADSGEKLKFSTFITSLIYGVKTPITV